MYSIRVGEKNYRTLFRRTFQKSLAISRCFFFFLFSFGKLYPIHAPFGFSTIRTIVLSAAYSCKNPCFSDRHRGHGDRGDDGVVGAPPSAAVLPRVPAAATDIASAAAAAVVSVAFSGSVAATAVLRAPSTRTAAPPDAGTVLPAAIAAITTRGHGHQAGAADAAPARGRRAPPSPPPPRVLLLLFAGGGGRWRRDADERRPR